MALSKISQNDLFPVNSAFRVIRQPEPAAPTCAAYEAEYTKQMNDFHFPTLGIDVFGQGAAEDLTVQFHQLTGRRVIDEPHQHDFLILILFEKGLGSHTIDFRKHEVADFQLHMLFPGQVHQWLLEKETVGYQLMIGQKAFEKCLPNLRFAAASYQQHPVVDMDTPGFQTLLHEFKAISAELTKADVFRELVYARLSVVNLLVCNLFHPATATEKLEDNPLTARFLSLVETSFRTDRSVASYAAQLSISANYLNMLCRKQLHASASSVIQDRVVLEAKRLLKTSRMTVKDIVYTLGFYDHANFAKFFKTQTGMTPTEFKEQS